MANSFGQYTGGIQGVQGISEAGANIGKFAQQGLADAGKSLAEGIQSYYTNQAESDAADANIKALGNNIFGLKNIVSQSPDLAPLSGQLDKYLMDLSDAPNLSKSKRVALAHSVSTGLNQFNQNVVLRQSVANANNEGKMAEIQATTLLESFKNIHKDLSTDPTYKPIVGILNAPITQLGNMSGKSVAEKKAIITSADAVMKSLPVHMQVHKEVETNRLSSAIQTGLDKMDKSVVSTESLEVDPKDRTYDFRTNESPTDYQARIHAHLQAMSDLPNATVDVSTVESDLMKKLPAKIEASNLSPAAKAVMLEQAKSQNLSEDAKKAMAWAGYGDVNLEDVSSELVGKTKKSAIQVMQEQKTAETEQTVGLKTQVKNLTAYNAFSEDITKKQNDFSIKALKELQEKIASGATPTEISRYYGFNTGSPQVTGQQLAFSFLNKEIYSKEKRDKGVMVDFNTDKREIAGTAYNNIISNFKNVQSKVSDALGIGSFWTSDTSKISSKNRQTAIDAIQTEIDRVSGGNKPTIETPKVTAPSILPETVQVDAGKVGTILQERQMDWEEKKVKLRELLTSKFGQKDINGNPVAPASLETLVGTLYPESKLKEHKIGGASFLYDGTHLVQVKQAGKEMTYTEKDKEAQKIYGTPSPEGNGIIPEQVSDGVALAGRWARDPEAQKKFNNSVTIYSSTARAVDKLQNIMKVPFKSWSPDQRADASKAIAVLMAGGKDEIFANARFAEWELKVVQKFVGDPTAVFKFDSSEAIKLDNALKDAQRHIRDMAKMGKVNVTFTPLAKESSKNEVASAREKKLGLR